ncbi:MAG: OmpA family protein [Candidatus Margulisbacteria bacterium]|nr:OmpA family protein [Candidatus Margulisiibacteriota bacterium]
MKKAIVLFCLVLSLLSFGYSANAVISPYLGYHYMDQTRDLNNAWEIGAYYTDQLSDRLFLDYNLGLALSSIKSSSEGKLLLAGGINALYNIANFDRITPYVLAGLGGDIGYQSRIGLNLGLGVKIKISNYFEPRLEVKNIYYGNTLGNDTVYQIILTWPIVNNKLEEAFKKTGKVEKLDMQIKFDSGEAIVKDDYTMTLLDYAEFLMFHPEVKLLIKGYTDNVGEAEANQLLSEQRAQAIANVLINKYGISNARITAQGFGEEDPVAANDTAEGRAMNRRIEASTL